MKLASLKAHINYKHGEGANAVTCPKCSKICSNVETYRAHMRTHDVERLKCPHDLCEKSFSNQKDLLIHIDNHHSSDQYICSAVGCGKEFDSKMSLEHHQRYHKTSEDADDTNNTVQCEKCQKVLKNKESLRTHTRDVHGTKRCCTIEGCNFKCSTARQLRDHVQRVHLGRMKYRCKFPGCEIQSNSKVHLGHHMAKHYDDRPFHCKMDGCTSAFVRLSDLKHHERYHLPPTFSCSICDKKFHQKSQAKTHEKQVHEKIRPYKCDECDASFSQPKHLENHQNTHSGLKPFICDHDGCDFAAASPDTLRGHKKRHHVEEYSKTMKKKEQDIHDWLLINGFDHLIREQRVEFRCQEKDATWIFIDFMIHRRSDDTIFLLELDENQHKDQYPVSCESLRPFKIIGALAEQLAGRRVVYCRLNPDAFKVNGETKRTYKVDRYKTFKHFYDTLPTPDKPLTIQYFYYDVNIDQEGQASLVVHDDLEFANDAKEVSLPPIY